MARGMISLDPDDVVRLGDSLMRGEFPCFCVQIDDCTIHVREDGLSSAEAVAAALVEGVKRLREHLASRQPQEPAADAVDVPA
jgi:hypothetical protein